MTNWRNSFIAISVGTLLTATVAGAAPGIGNGNQCRFENETDAVNFCGQLDVNLLANVCTPYVNAHLTSLCRPVVNANASAWCGEYVEQEVELRLNQRIGDISNFCGGDVDLTKIAFHLGDINARCRQAQSTAQDVALAVEQANTVSLSASQTCEASRQECSTAVAQAVSQVVHCPDFQPICAKWVKRRRKYYVVDPVAQKKVPVVDRVTLCAKWAKPPVTVAP